LIGFTTHLSDGAGSQYLEPILHTGEGHLITVAPTGAGKGVGCIIPSLLRYQGPVIVIDPKGENYAVTAAARRKMGQKVVALDPFGIAGGKTDEIGRFNPLDFLSPENPTLVEDAEMIATTLMSSVRGTPRDPFWSYMGGQLLTLILLYQVKRLPPDQWNLTHARQLLGQPLDVWHAFGEMLAKDDDPVLKQLAGLAGNPAKETFGGYWAHSHMQIAQFKGEAIEECTETSSFSLQELVDGDPLSIYIIIPPERLESNGNLLKVWLAVMIAALTHRRSKPERSTLFLLDEAAQLGAMPQLRQAITLLRGYGVRVWSFWQDLSQLQGLYPTTWQTLLNNCHVHQFFAQSTLLGSKQTYEVTGLGHPEYLQKLQPGEMVLSVIGDQPVIAQTPNYLRDEPFKGMYDSNPFYESHEDDDVPRSRRVFRRSVVDYDSKDQFGRSANLGKYVSEAIRFHPVSRSRWEDVTGELREQLMVDLMKDYSGLEEVQLENIEFRKWPLSFYEEYDYFEIVINRAGRRYTGYFVRKPGEAIYLDGQSSQLHELNKSVALKLELDQAVDYLYFFCTSMDTEGGRFLVVDNISDINFRLEPDEDYLAAVEKVIKPPTQLHIPDKTRSTDADLKNWVFTANVVYADGLFKAEFRVWSNGAVEMIDSEELFGQMPIIRDDNLRQYRAQLTPKQEQDTQ
jgi:type IV secretion system protein VirD4